jgi:hypothetical protein
VLLPFADIAVVAVGYHDLAIGPVPAFGPRNGVLAAHRTAEIVTVLNRYRLHLVGTGERDNGASKSFSIFIRHF